MRMLCEIRSSLLCWRNKCSQPENKARKFIESINLCQRTKWHQEHHLASMVEFLDFLWRTLICFIFLALTSAFLNKKPPSASEKAISSSSFINVRSSKLKYRLRTFSPWTMRKNITNTICKNYNNLMRSEVIHFQCDTSISIPSFSTIRMNHFGGSSKFIKDHTESFVEINAATGKKISWETDTY